MHRARKLALVLILPVMGAAILLVARAAPELGRSQWSDPLTDLAGLEVVDGVVAGPSGLELATEAVTLTDGIAELATGAMDGVTVEPPVEALRLAQAGFGPAHVLNSSTAGGQWPSLGIAPSGLLHVAWHSTLASPVDVFTSRSADAGDSWTAPLKMPRGTGSARYSPTLAVGPTGRVHVAWHELGQAQSGIYYAVSSNQGQNWVTSTVKAGANQSYPRIAVDTNETAHLAWVWDAGDNQSAPGIYYAASRNWGVRTRISHTDNPGAMDRPGIAARGTRLYAAWPDSRSGQFTVYVGRSLDAGLTWATEAAPSPWQGDPARPHAQDQLSLIIASDGSVVVAWRDSRNLTTTGYDIFVSRSADGGTSWSVPVSVTRDTARLDQNDPQLVEFRPGGLYAVWRQPYAGKQDLFYAFSLDYGQSWSASFRVESGAGGYEHGAPSAVADALGRVHVIWEDRRTTAPVPLIEIYTARSSSYRSSGVLTSTVKDAGALSLGTLTFSATVPTSTTLEFRVRGGDSPVPDATWSPWSEPMAISGSTISIPAARYLQYRAELATSAGFVTPLVSEVSLTMVRHVHSGTARSVAISPAGVGSWGSLVYTSVTPPGTRLSVDVLAADGSILIGGAAPGTSLAGVSATAHGAIRLQARLETENGAVSPRLEGWAVTWTDQPTATPTATHTPTATPSVTPTPTAAPSTASTPSPTLSPTPSATPGATAASTDTAVPSDTATGTPTLSETAPPTGTATASQTPTLTYATTPTRTATPRAAASETATPTAAASTVPTPEERRRFLPVVARG